MEIKREVVGTGNKDKAVAESGEENDDVVPVVEQTRWNDRVLSKLPLCKHTQAPGENSKDDQADDGSRSPGIVDSTELESEEEHERATDYENGSSPVDVAQTGQEWCLGRFNMEEEEQNSQRSTADGH